MTLATRVVSGIVVAIAISVLLLIGEYFPKGTYLTGLAALAVVGISAFEYGGFFKDENGSRSVRFSATALTCTPSVVIVLASFLGGNGSQYTVLSPLFRYFVLGALVALFAVISIVLYSKRDENRSTEISEGSLLLGVIYLGIGGGALTTLALLPDTTSLLAWMIAVVAMQDVAAYFGGRKFGSTPLAPSISPNKTLGGAFCGLIGSVITGLILYRLIGNTGSALFLSLFVGLGSQIGDLAESHLKRLHGVKDSGSLIPGHGGVFDRIDSHLGASFVIIIWLLLGELIS